jgi:hypothetical protein
VRLISWVKSHKIVVAAAVLALYLLYRWRAGLNLLSTGHATPADAIAAGYMVYPAGVTGWKEVDPDGKREVWHDTGWVNPFTGVG